MIVTVTGVPGAGKTLYALTWVKNKAEKESRPVFYSGIKDLQLPWTEIEPEKWAEVPSNSIVVIDECQRVFRPRMHGSAVPPFVAALETHRHLGIDLVFITQHPMLIDQNVRRLCGLHFHVVRKWGTHAATVHEWSTIKENCDKSRSDSIRHSFRYPKANFALYKSAEVHTHKARIPVHFYILGAVPVLLGLAGWKLYNGTFSMARGAEVGAPGQAPGEANARAFGSGYGTGGKDAKAPMTAVEFVAQYQPRLAGLPHTAPVYDEVTKPTEAPYPAACIQSAKRCECYTQQGTKLADTPAQLCADIARGGFFVAWRAPMAAPGGVPGAAPGVMPGQVVNAVPLMASAQPMPGAGSLGGSGHGMFARPSDGGSKAQ